MHHLNGISTTDKILINWLLYREKFKILILIRFRCMQLKREFTQSKILSKKIFKPHGSVVGRSLRWNEKKSTFFTDLTNSDISLLLRFQDRLQYHSYPLYTRLRQADIADCCANRWYSRVYRVLCRLLGCNVELASIVWQLRVLCGQ